MFTPWPTPLANDAETLNNLAETAIGRSVTISPHCQPAGHEHSVPAAAHVVRKEALPELEHSLVARDLAELAGSQEPPQPASAAILGFRSSVILSQYPFNYVNNT